MLEHVLRAAAEAVIERARVAGFAALVVTIDTAVSGMRERDYRNGMKELISGNLLARSMMDALERQIHRFPLAKLLHSSIKDLLEAKIIERTLDGYRLTKIGQELFVLLEPYQAWAMKWAKLLK